MAKIKDDKKVTVVAQLNVTSADGIVEVVKGFDKAWHRALDLSKIKMPVSVLFVDFVRID